MRWGVSWGKKMILITEKIAVIIKNVIKYRKYFFAQGKKPSEFEILQSSHLCYYHQQQQKQTNIRQCCGGNSRHYGGSSKHIAGGGNKRQCGGSRRHKAGEGSSCCWIMHVHNLQLCTVCFCKNDAYVGPQTACSKVTGCHSYRLFDRQYHRSPNTVQWVAAALSVPVFAHSFFIELELMRKAKEFIIHKLAHIYYCESKHQLLQHFVSAGSVLPLLSC